MKRGRAQGHLWRFRKVRSEIIRDRSRGSRRDRARPMRAISRHACGGCQEILFFGHVRQHWKGTRYYARKFMTLELKKLSDVSVRRWVFRGGCTRRCVPAVLTSITIDMLGAASEVPSNKHLIPKTRRGNWGRYFRLWWGIEEAEQVTAWADVLKGRQAALMP